MKKTKELIALFLGVIILIVSYMHDVDVKLLFKDASSPILDVPLSVITNFGFVIIALAIIPSIILYGKNKKKVYVLWTTLLASIIAALLIKLLVLRQRPIEGFSYPIITAINYSFPSMHAMAAFSMLPLLVKYIPRHKFFWVIFALIVAFSRIYFRFHFLSDVIFGIFAGLIIGVYFLRMHEKGKLWK